LSYRPANCLAAFWTAQDGPAIPLGSTKPGNVQDGFGVGSGMSRSPQSCSARSVLGFPALATFPHLVILFTFGTKAAVWISES
jgi:hypothetical protein